MKKSLIHLAVVGAMAIGTSAQAELTGNVGVSNNYLWRGVTQTTDNAAVWGGLDYSQSLFYAGTWVSNVDFAGGYEMDLYLGLAGDAGPVTWDVGYIYYYYPVNDPATGDEVEADFGEVYGSVGYGPVSIYAATTVNAEFDDDDGTYVAGSLALPITEELEFGATVGNYSGSIGEVVSGDDDGYMHYMLSLSKDDFTFAVEANDIDNADDPRFTVSWGKEFSLM
jgi:uncharacterized protein (TIGR02001 family)